MKPTLARRSLAERAANTVLRDAGVTGLWVDPISIATAKGITVRGKPDTAEGVSGLLVKAGDEFGILYATNIKSRGFQRFSIAHEIGHYCIEDHCEALLDSGLHVSHAGFVSADPFEQEADHFAAALLMPERAFTRAIDDHDAGLGCVEALARGCETSLSATAIRYSALTRDAVAVILTRGQTVEWSFMSNGMKQVRGWIKKGTAVPSGTATSSFNDRPEDVRAGGREEGDGRLIEWMDTGGTYKVTEEVIGLGQYGRTLTILTCGQLTERPEADDADEEDEEAFTERWTPRFKR